MLLRFLFTRFYAGLPDVLNSGLALFARGSIFVTRNFPAVCEQSSFFARQSFSFRPPETQSSLKSDFSAEGASSLVQSWRALELKSASKNGQQQPVSGFSVAEAVRSCHAAHLRVCSSKRFTSEVLCAESSD